MNAQNAASTADTPDPLEHLASALFRQAAEQPGAPWQAARIHAELLREMGRPAEALAWLKSILPTLPADDPAARREVVQQRIRELESLVGSP